MWPNLCCTYPMTLSDGEGRSFLRIRFEELVREMLCEKCKHQAGALRVRDKLPSPQNPLGQQLGIRKLFFTWKCYRDLSEQGCDPVSVQKLKKKTASSVLLGQIWLCYFRCVSNLLIQRQGPFRDFLVMQCNQETIAQNGRIWENWFSKSR